MTVTELVELSKVNDGALIKIVFKDEDDEQLAMVAAIAKPGDVEQVVSLLEDLEDRREDGE